MEEACTGAGTCLTRLRLTLNTWPQVVRASHHLHMQPCVGINPMMSSRIASARNRFDNQAIQHMGDHTFLLCILHLAWQSDSDAVVRSDLGLMYGLLTANRRLTYFQFVQIHAKLPLEESSPI